jgi:predicted site-specific integrase-resolvase
MNDTSPVSRFLNQKGLAKRWDISVHTLERWRCYGHGPNFLKSSNRVRYDIQDVEAYEAKHFANHT